MREKGALAVEALHRQVLPFILRRVKEQVLKDLPPKIIQDVYCDLSPLQTQLYEEYSLKQKLVESEDSGEEDGNFNGKKEHVFLALQHLKKVGTVGLFQSEQCNLGQAFFNIFEKKLNCPCQKARA